MNREQIETLRLAVQRRSVQLLDGLPSPWNKRGWFILRGMGKYYESRWEWLEEKADKILLHSGYIKHETPGIGWGIFYTEEPKNTEMSFSPLGDPRYN